MRLVRTYNSNDDSVDDELGKGWRLGISDGAAGSSGSGGSLDLMQIVNVLFGGNAFDMTDVDGTRHHFVRDAGGTWISPPGVNLKVTTPLLGGYYDFTRPDGVTYRFEPFGGSINHRLTSIKDRKGNFLNFGYDGANKPLTITDTLNRSISFDYLSGPNVRFATFTGAGSTLVVEYQYEGGRLKRVIRQPDTLASPTAVYNYNSQGLSQVTDRRGNTTNFTVPAGGTRLSKITDRAGKDWNFSYTGGACLPNGPATTAVCLQDPELNSTIWSTNARGNLLFRRDAGDKTAAGASRFNTASFEWGSAGNENNRLTKEIDEVGNSTSYSYNGLGQIIGSVNVGIDGTSMTSSFPMIETGTVGDIDKVITAVGTAEQRTWDFSYDLLGKGTLVSVNDPLNKQTKMTYYDRGMLRTVEDANGKVTTYGDIALTVDGGYDASGQPGKIVDPLAQTTNFLYDFLGHPREVTDRNLKLWKTEYDLRGNLRESIDPLGHTITNCFDGNDNLTLSIPARSPSRACSLDGADGWSTKTSYDARDRISSSLTKSDGKLRKSTYSYFDDGELKEIVEPRSFDTTNGVLFTDPAKVQKAAYQRFANNRVSAFVNEEGKQTDVIYTPHGLIEKVTDPMGDLGRHTVAYTYNRTAQVKSAQESGHAQAMRYDYNLHGDKIKLTTPKGTMTLIAPDAMGRPLTITDPNNKVTTREYDNVGNLKLLKQPTVGRHLI